MSNRIAALGVFALLGASFGVSQFIRTAPAVLAPELRRELGLAPEMLGLVFGLFFVAFTLVHLPVGALLDRYGPRRVMGAMLLLSAGGTFVFASGEDAGMLIAGQMLSGLGSSAAFVGGLAVIARWYPRERFGPMASWLTAIGGIGPILSGTPFAALVEAIGWRDAWRIGGVALAIAGLLILALVRNAPPGHADQARAPERLRDTLKGFGPVLRTRQVWGIIALAVAAFAVQIAVRGLWGGPYLADIAGFGAIARGNLLLAMSAAGALGAIAFGWLEHCGVPRLALILYGTLTVIGTYALLAALPSQGDTATALLFVFVGFSGPYTILLLAHARALFPDHLTGRAITTVNVANFLGVSVMQIVPGWILGAFPAVDGHPPEIAYRTMFGVLAATLAVALLAFLRWGARGRR
ncbi:MAG: MFS transporter [Alphaproteobacteria bacterium]